VVIGIEDYQHVPPPKYAANDAKAFYQHPVNRTQIPGENVTLLLDREASLSRLRSTLGTHLKNKAGKEDMVILYFAGCGATETETGYDQNGWSSLLMPATAVQAEAARYLQELSVRVYLKRLSGMETS
jgi:hypothetical protein